MALREMFFDGEFTGEYDDQDQPIYDRMYGNDDWNSFMATIATNGIVPTNSDFLKVIANGDMQIAIQVGTCFINGHMGEVYEENYILELDESDSTYSRIDNIVYELNIPDRTMSPKIVKGENASSPVPPDIVRNANVYQLVLAEVTVNALSTEITDNNIYSRRGDSAYCPWSQSFLELDTSGWFGAFQSEFDTNLIAWQNEFNSFMVSSDGTWEDFYNTSVEEMNNIKTDYAIIKENISALTYFSFDDLKDLKGSTKKTEFNEDTSITETVYVTTGPSLIVGLRDTLFNSDGSITTTSVVYDDDYTTKLVDSTITTIFEENGSIIEEVN